MQCAFFVFFLFLLRFLCQIYKWLMLFCINEVSSIFWRFCHLKSENFLKWIVHCWERIQYQITYPGVTFIPIYNWPDFLCFLYLQSLFLFWDVCLSTIGCFVSLGTIGKEKSGSFPRSWFSQFKELWFSFQSGAVFKFIQTTRQAFPTFEFHGCSPTGEANRRCHCTVCKVRLNCWLPHRKDAHSTVLKRNYFATQLDDFAYQRRSAFVWIGRLLFGL